MAFLILRHTVPSTQQDHTNVQVTAQIWRYAFLKSISLFW